MRSVVEAISHFLALGGCTKNPDLRPKLAVVAHKHTDHIPADHSIRIVGPVSFKGRRFDYIPYNYSETYLLESHHTFNEYLKIFVFGDRTLRNYGVHERLHAPPIVITYFTAKHRRVLHEESALYIEDFDLKDVPRIKRLEEELGLRVNLKAIILPAYSGAKAHGAEDPKELSEASKELTVHFLRKGHAVILLSHPVKPVWFEDLKYRYFDKLLIFDRNLEVVADLKKEGDEDEMTRETHKSSR